MAEIRVSTKTASHAAAAGASPLSLVPTGTGSQIAAGAGGQIAENDQITASAERVTASAEPGARPERRRHVENATIIRCMKAWNYAYRKEAENLDDDESDYPAQKAANEAYLRATPPLNGYENICDFIACINFASMTDIVTHSEAEHYLANARTALAAFFHHPKSAPGLTNLSGLTGLNHTASSTVSTGKPKRLGRPRKTATNPSAQSAVRELLDGRKIN
jgi:hypothetical protein